uniref:Uncharacterized protein n=1 Tax=Panagrolaimus sp. JU765 TaxID=591449 RepID=A0AC34PWF1_9BILA
MKREQSVAASLLVFICLNVVVLTFAAADASKSTKNAEINPFDGILQKIKAGIGSGLVLAGKKMSKFGNQILTKSSKTKDEPLKEAWEKVKTGFDNVVDKVL